MNTVIEIKAIPQNKYLTVVIEENVLDLYNVLNFLEDLEKRLSSDAKFFTVYLKVPFDFSFHVEILKRGYQTSFSLIGMYINLKENYNKIIATAKYGIAEDGSLSIIEIREDNLEKYIDVYQRIFEIPMSLKSIFDLIKKYEQVITKKESSETKILALVKSNEIIGIARFSIFKEDLHLLNFGIIEEERRKGYGTYFLTKLLEKFTRYQYERVTLDVSSNNLTALHFYLRLGFVVGRDPIIYVKNVYNILPPNKKLYFSDKSVLE
ncbi:MAG: GNAT family N-acetyltransferase [Candidatus Asgardarchaeia archaeon]